MILTKSSMQIENKNSYRLLDEVICIFSEGAKGCYNLHATRNDVSPSRGISIKGQICEDIPWCVGTLR